MKSRAYVSGVLTGVESLDVLKKFYEDISRVCAAEGVAAYVPHLVTDPVKNAEFTPKEVYELDRLKG